MGEIIDISSASRVHKHEWVENGVRFFRSSDVMATHNGNNNEKAYISVELYNRLSLKSGKVKIDDILVTGGGTVGMPFIITTDEPLYFKDADLIWLKNSEVIDGNFLYNFFISPLFKKYIKSVSHIGTISHYTIEQAKDTPIKLPSFTEQQKIGDIFKQLNNALTLHQRKLDKLIQLKQGYLQQLFPKNDEKVPRVRFANYDENWEQRKLSSMTIYKNGKGHEDKQSTSGNLELINLNSISISGGLKYSGKFIDEADDTLQKDDLVMILSDVGHGDLLGRVALIPEDNRFVLNQRVALLRPNATADPHFLFSYINAHQYYFKAQGAGMSQLNISKASVENFISNVPQLSEQNKIGALFKQLDDTIILHQSKFDKLNSLKQALLQKMFI